MENLDPLRQKPDFEEYANEHAGTHSASTQIAVGIKQGCEHVWTSHVEPLMKELDALKAKVWTCPICRKDHLMPDRICDHGSSVFHHGFNIQSMNTHKIGGDPFPKNDAVQEQQSIEGNKYVKVKSIQIPEIDTAIEKYKSDRDKFAIEFARFCQVDLRGRTFEDLMNEFKESLLNQKP